MSEAIEIAKVSAKGSFNFFWGLVVSTFISAIYVIMVARLLSPSEYGLVAVALTAPGLASLFRDWGVNSAVVKYVAQYRSENRLSELKSIATAGILFKLVSGLVLSLIQVILLTRCLGL